MSILVRDFTKIIQKMALLRRAKEEILKAKNEYQNFFIKDGKGINGGAEIMMKYLE